MYSGLSQAEAEKVIASTPLKLELFYDVGRGSFAIDAEAVGNTPLYNCMVACAVGAGYSGGA